MQQGYLWEHLLNVRCAVGSGSSLVCSLKVCRRFKHIHPLLPLEGKITQHPPPLSSPPPAIYILPLVSKVRSPAWKTQGATGCTKPGPTSFSDGDDAEEKRQKKKTVLSFCCILTANRIWQSHFSAASFPFPQINYHISLLLAIYFENIQIFLPLQCKYIN